MSTSALTVNQVVVATAVEVDATGASVPVVPANLTATIDVGTVASVVSNGDGTFNVTAVGAGTAILTVTDTVNMLSGTGTVTVTSSGSGTTGTPVSLTITFGTPSTVTEAPTTTSNLTSQTGTTVVQSKAEKL